MASATGKFNRVRHSDEVRQCPETGIIYPYRASDPVWSQAQLEKVKARNAYRETDEWKAKYAASEAKKQAWRDEHARLKNMTKQERYAEIGIVIDDEGNRVG